MSPALPANTAAEASQAAISFLPGSAGKASLSILPDSSPLSPWDVTEPCASVRRQLQAAFDGLRAGRAEPCLSLLAADYRQTERGNGGREKIAKEETERRLRAALTRNRCTSVKFGITSAQMAGPDTMTLIGFEQIVFLSRNTPDTHFTLASGKIAVVSNTSRVTTTQIQRQAWERKGSGWQMHSAEALQAKFSAVL